MSADRPSDTGATLRGARERKGVTLRQIADRTKISIAALEALERNDISRLPGGIFSRAFVRSYANEVGLDAEATIQAFMAQFPEDSVTAGHPRTDRVEDTELFQSEQRVASSVVWLFVVSVAVAGAAIYFGMMRRGSTDATTAAPVVSSQPEVRPDAPPAGGTATAAAPSPAPDPAPSIAPPAAPSTAATASPSSALPPLLPPPSGAAQILTIELSARRPVYVSATVDGQKQIGRLLQTGEREMVEVRREMVITAGDAAAIKMTINGGEARALGKTGEVVTARLNLTNYKDYLPSR